MVSAPTFLKDGLGSGSINGNKPFLPLSGFGHGIEHSLLPWFLVSI